MLITAKNVLFKKKTETVVRKSSTQDPQKQICSMNGKNMASKKGSKGMPRRSQVTPKTTQEVKLI